MVSGRQLSVVQLLPALQSGGVERGTLEIGKYLAEKGHRSLVISAGGALRAQLEAQGSEHLTWDIGRKSPLTLIRFVPRLRRFLREQAVDILHVRSRMPGWVAYLAWRGMDPRTRPRLVTTVHGMYSANAYSAVMTRGERIIAVSRTVRDYILENYGATDPTRIHVIPRGVDRLQYPFGYSPGEAWRAAWRARYPALSGKKLLLLPGRITRLKGHEDFIRLMQTLIARDLPVHGLIVGGAEPRKQAYLDELRALVTELRLTDAITFTGPTAELREIMAIAQIVYSLSTKPESFGRTVLEALSLGVPVIGYAHGGVGEQLQALLPAGGIPPGDTAALAQLTARWLASPPAIPADHDFRLQDMLEATLALYRLALEDR